MQLCCQPPFSIIREVWCTNSSNSICRRFRNSVQIFTSRTRRWDGNGMGTFLFLPQWRFNLHGFNILSPRFTAYRPVIPASREDQSIIYHKLCTSRPPTSTLHRRYLCYVHNQLPFYMNGHEIPAITSTLQYMHTHGALGAAWTLLKFYALTLFIIYLFLRMFVYGTVGTRLTILDFIWKGG